MNDLVLQREIDKLTPLVNEQKARIATLETQLDAAMRVVESARKLRNKVHRKGDQWRPKADPVPLRYLAELEDFDKTLADFDAARKAG